MSDSNVKLSADISSMLLELEFFQANEEVNDFLEDNGVKPNALIQSLIFEKEVFLSEAEATEWCGSHGFRFDVIEEDKKQYKILQFSEAEFELGSLTEIELRRGIKAIAGNLLINECIVTHLSLRNEKTMKFDESLPSIIELAKVVSGVHPAYGKVEITQEMLKSYERNFKDKVTGVDISIDYDHETREAAGWLESVFLSYDGMTLLGAVKWTPRGALSLSSKEFRYFSPELSQNYVHPHTGVSHGPTLIGGALVNRPFLKMEAIVALKETKLETSEVKMDTIALSEHKEAIESLESKLNELKLSEETKTKELEGLKEDVKKLSEENNSLKEAAAKKAKAELHNKLFSEGKINKAQLDALNEGKDPLDVLALSEKMNTQPVGKDGSNDENTVQLSEIEKQYCKKLNISEADYIKYNKGVL